MINKWNSVYGIQLVRIFELHYASATCDAAQYIVEWITDVYNDAYVSSVDIGQEEFDRLRSLSYAETHVIMICFSVDNPTSLENVESKVCLSYHFTYTYPIMDHHFAVVGWNSRALSRC